MPPRKAKPRSPSKSTSDRAGTGGVWALLFVGLAAVAVLLVYVRSVGTRVPEDRLRPSRDGSGPTADAPPPADTPDVVPRKVEVEVLHPRYDDGELSYEPHAERVPPGTDPYLYAVNQYLGQLGDLLPEGARAVRAQRDGATLVLQFSPAFATTYGTEDERTLVDGLRHTLGQFPEIERFSIQVDGQPLDTLGNLDLTEPLTVSRPKAGSEAGPGTSGGGGSPPPSPPPAPR